MIVLAKKGWGTRQSLNKFAYVQNNPSNFVDPLGLFSGPEACADDSYWISHAECPFAQDGGFGTGFYIIFLGIGEGGGGAGGGDIGGTGGGGSGSSGPGQTIHFPNETNGIPNGFPLHTPTLADFLVPNSGTCDFGPCGFLQTRPVHGVWHYGNWCGEDGMGIPLPGTDEWCMWHDLHFGALKIDWTFMRDASKWNTLPRGVQSQVRDINQGLCDGIAKVKIPWWDIGQKTAAGEIQYFFHNSVPLGARCH